MYNELAPYYDKLYAQKDYKAECRFLQEVFRHCKSKPKTILDVGCGTGEHSGALSKMGYKMHGIDISDGMVSIARGKHSDASFSVHDVRQPFSESIFDAAISMFGTMSYMITEKDLYYALSNINGAMKDNGILVFDGWNAYAVARTVQPNGKLIKIDNDLFKYTELLPQDRYHATFKFTLLDLKAQKTIDEEERFCLFTRKMIEEVFSKTGFELLYYWKLFSPGVEPTVNDWKVSVVAKKVDNA